MIAVHAEVAIKNMIGAEKKPGTQRKGAKLNTAGK